MWKRIKNVVLRRHVRETGHPTESQESTTECNTNTKRLQTATTPDPTPAYRPAERFLPDLVETKDVPNRSTSVQELMKKYEMHAAKSCESVFSSSKPTLKAGRDASFDSIAEYMPPVTMINNREKAKIIPARKWEPVQTDKGATQKVMTPAPDYHSAEPSTASGGNGDLGGRSLSVHELKKKLETIFIEGKTTASVADRRSSAGDLLRGTKEITDGTTRLLPIQDIKHGVNRHLNHAPKSIDKVALAAKSLAENMRLKSKKIQDAEGFPSVYKLSMKEEMRNEQSKIAKQSIGEPVQVKDALKDKVLLVVGETGAGKSTLINGMVNYILGVQWDDDFRLMLITEDEKVSQAHSQTKDMTAYTFYPEEGSVVPYIFTIIDTPGFGDTEGLKRDKAITGQIKDFFSVPAPNGIDHLDGIGFVIQASQARLTPSQRYVFDSVLSVFGNDVKQNIFLMITYADGQRPPVLDAIKEANIPSENVFKFNNSALFSEKQDAYGEMFWKMGLKSFQDFFSKFQEAESVSLQLTKEVLKERERLQVLIEGLNPKIVMGLNKIEEMRQDELAVQHFEKEIETNKHFKFKVNVPTTRKVDIAGTGRHTTTCLRCNFTCHTDCKIPDDTQKRNCVAMAENGFCTVCTQNCWWDEHKNLPYLILYETVEQEKTSEDLKKKYDKAISGKSRKQRMISQLEKCLQDMHAEVLTMVHQTQQSHRRLDEIALKPNPLTEVQYIEILIESEKREGKDGWKQRVDYYEEAKRHAEILSKVKDEKEVQKMIQKQSRGAQSWYSRFKFW